MVTTCPACTTTFRVTPPQLSQSNGRVRCGRCTNVFDAFKSLASLPDQTIPEPAASRAATAAPFPSIDIGIPAPGNVGSPSVAIPVPVKPLQPGPPVDDPVTIPVMPVEPGHARTDAAGAGSAGTLPAAGAGLQLPLAIDPVASVPERHVAYAARPLPGRRRGVAIAAMLLLVLAAVLQAIYAFRTEIAAAVPELRPGLERACAAIGCRVAYPKQPQHLSIEGSDLSVPDAAKPGLIVLSATIRNRAPHAVAYPSIELTLTNAQDQTVARRVFPPSDYAGHAAAGALAAGAEAAVKLDIDTGELRASGYRLFLFYP
jgi:predicted Zn finger-like uncharacterized protein